MAIALECLPLAVRRRWPAALPRPGVARLRRRPAPRLPHGRGHRAAHRAAERGRPPGTPPAHHRGRWPPRRTCRWPSRSTGSGRPSGVDGFVTFYLALALAWGIGAWLRQTRAAEAERRRHVAEATRAAERTRIARELHDVVTHHVTAMVVQAEAARYLTAAPDRLDETLTAVTDTGRRAIADLRHLLDLLNPGPRRRRRGRRPSASCTRSSSRPGGPGSRWSSPRRARRRSRPAAPRSSAYRVVQEALTNALKYAHGSRTAVHVRHGEREITVEVSTDGSGLARRASPAGAGAAWPGSANGSTCSAASSARAGGRTAASSSGPASPPGARRDRADPGPGLRRPGADPHRVRDDHRRPARPGGGGRVRGRARRGRPRRPAAARTSW